MANKKKKTKKSVKNNNSKNSNSIKTNTKIETNDNVVIHEESNDVISHEEEKASIVIAPKKETNKEEILVKKKNLINKKSMIIFSIILLIIVSLFFLLSFRKTEKNMGYYINNSKLNEVKDFSFNNDGFIASKYKIDNSKLFKSNEDVSLDDYKGRLLYIRDNKMNLNIFQSYLDVNEKVEGIPTLIIMSQTMNSFEEKCLNELGIPKDIKMKENYYGKSKFKFKLSPEESVLKENRIYTKSFEYKKIKYEINYYIDENNLVCEFVRFV